MSRESGSFEPQSRSYINHLVRGGARSPAKPVSMRQIPCFRLEAGNFSRLASAKNPCTTRNGRTLKALIGMARKMWRKQSRELGSNEQGFGNQLSAASREIVLLGVFGHLVSVSASTRRPIAPQANSR